MSKVIQGTLDKILGNLLKNWVIFNGMLRVTAPMDGDFVDGHVDWVLEVIFGQYLIHFLVVIEEALNF